mmetsp:Transcript_54743/g.132928  ORF Transcript_54743/g.132928 Transcript_54743/m.132928 type:complete len:125 (+) Transcript_54743:1451-1825(+)
MDDMVQWMNNQLCLQELDMGISKPPSTEAAATASSTESSTEQATVPSHELKSTLPFHPRTKAAPAPTKTQVTPATTQETQNVSETPIDVSDPHYQIPRKWNMPFAPDCLLAPGRSGKPDLIRPF